MMALSMVSRTWTYVYRRANSYVKRPSITFWLSLASSVTSKVCKSAIREAA